VSNYITAIAQRDCPRCGRRNVMVTLTVDRHDPIDILGTLRKACDPWALEQVARAILQDGTRTGGEQPGA
jgi:hypothetical protein